MPRIVITGHVGMRVSLMLALASIGGIVVASDTQQIDDRLRLQHPLDDIAHWKPEPMTAWYAPAALSNWNRLRVANAPRQCRRNGKKKRNFNRWR